MPVTIQEYAARAVGQRDLLDAKIAEFRALACMGANTEQSREDTHTLLDAMLDGIAEFSVAAMRGDFS